jgi:hypothetical protein
MTGPNTRLTRAQAMKQQKNRMTENDAYRVKAKKGGKMKKKKSFPDMSGDGKVTKKDILMARGIIKKPMKKKKK